MKKKLLALFAALTLSITPVYADLPDISGLSLEELLQLQQMVNTAVNDMGGGYEFGQGSYVVGKDIVSGTYRLTHPEGTGTQVIICENSEQYENLLGQSLINNESIRKAVSKYAIDWIQLYSNDECTVNLSDDQVLFLLYNGAIVKQESNPFAPQN